MGINWKQKSEIDEVIKEIACSRVIRFYPTYISKITLINLDTVFEYLLELVDDGSLNILWEIRCPDFDCNSVILRTHNLSEIMGKEIECDYCENGLLVRRQHVFPVFEINDDFREFLKQSKKKQVNYQHAL
ncbi:hypothetical protein [Bacillus vallismortis]|uniref:hypothetical protein n=1 Tax=Bacillus vallismortis TaxID=72361 RepID=UPI0022830AC9|nr:hypothetical protein [Bacillus vallismortis]MCY7919578.1 hypothetical protein [Bacillus vallismortis]